MCVCMNENAAPLQPADHWLSNSPGGAGAAGAGWAPPCVHVCVCVFYKVVSILTKRYADDMLRAVILIQVSIRKLIQYIQLYQEIIIN